MILFKAFLGRQVTLPGATSPAGSATSSPACTVYKQGLFLLAKKTLVGEALGILAFGVFLGSQATVRKGETSTETTFKGTETETSCQTSQILKRTVAGNR